MNATVKQLNIKVVDEGLDETIAKVKTLGSELQNIGSKKSQGVSVNQTKQEAKATKETSTNLKQQSNSLRKMVVSLISIRKLSGFFRDALDESSSWIENLNLFEVALDNCTEQGLKFTKTMSEAFGLDQNQLVEYMGLFNQMAQAIGNSTEIAYKMSEALTALGLDISSLYNISVEGAMSKLRSGIAGQVKPVRELGLDITAQSLDKYLKEDLGLDMTSKALSQSQKQLLRTIMLIQQTKNAWGDLSKTINTFSNQQKILTAQITQLKRAFGDLLIGTTEQAGIATRALYYINGALMALNEIIRTIIPEASSSGFNKVQEDVNETNKNIKEMEEELNKSLFSFDKFNSLNTGDDKKGLDWISELLEEGFLKEYQDYMAKFEKSMKNIQNEATKVKEAILTWLGYEPEFDAIAGAGEDLTDINWKLKDGYTNLEKIKDIVIVLVNIIISKQLTNGLLNLITNFQNLAKIQNGALYGSMFALVSLITYMIMNWKDLDDSGKAIIATLTSIVGILVAMQVVIKAMNTKQLASAVLSLTLKFGSLKTALLSCGTALSIVAIGMYSFFSILNNDSMSGVQKVIAILGTLTATVLGAALALGAFHSAWTMGAAAAGIAGGIALVIGAMKSAKTTIGQFANGGYPDTGQLFIANEAGPEIVGNIGGRTAVANNDMIVQAIENASYRGHLRAIGNGTNNNLSISFRDVNANDLSRALSQSMIKEFQRQGYKVSKA